MCVGLDIAEQEDMLSSGHPVAWDTEQISDMQMILSHLEACDARAMTVCMHACRAGHRGAGGHAEQRAPSGLSCEAAPSTRAGWSHARVV